MAGWLAGWLSEADLPFAFAVSATATYVPVISLNILRWVRFMWFTSRFVPKIIKENWSDAITHVPMCTLYLNC